MTNIEVIIDKREIAIAVNRLFAKFGSDEDQKIAKKNLRKLKVVAK